MGNIAPTVLVELLAILQAVTPNDEPFADGVAHRSQNRTATDAVFVAYRAEDRFEAHGAQPTHKNRPGYTTGS